MAYIVSLKQVEGKNHEYEVCKRIRVRRAFLDDFDFYTLNMDIIRPLDVGIHIAFRLHSVGNWKGKRFEKSEKMAWKVIDWLRECDQNSPVSILEV